MRATSPSTGRSSLLATIALIAHETPDAVIAWRAGTAIRADQFLADVHRVAAALPAGGYVLNACVDRYRFAVGFAAALVARKVSLLPSTHTPEVIRQLALFAPGVFCLTDEARCEIDLPRIAYPLGANTAGPGVGGGPGVAAAAEPSAAVRPSAAAAPPAGGAQSWPPPAIDTEQTAAYVFTSGSTGAPLPYPKTWGRLVRCVRDGAARFGLLDGRSYALVGTVPPQHMYGFESTVLLALQSPVALCADHPFYPADICAALERVPRPRVLVSTPVHLRTLIAADLRLPAVDLILSATAPLSQNLAREVERRFDAPLQEIYGSTETGQIATRRTAQEVPWRLWPGVSLKPDEERTWAAGGHVEQRTPMCDVIEITGEEHFLLHGRMADLVNIAGKRSSLAYLSHQLNAIPGVVDGAFFLRDEEASHDESAITRVAAVVVAPDVNAQTLLEELRKRVDPVFLPRPLLFVDKLPRNATGKLPREALQALVTKNAVRAARD